MTNKCAAAYWFTKATQYSTLKSNEDERTLARQFSNYGELWSVPERRDVKALFELGFHLEMICKRLKRPPRGVIAKLALAGLVRMGELGELQSLTEKGSKALSGYGVAISGALVKAGCEENKTSKICGDFAEAEFNQPKEIKMSLNNLNTLVNIEVKTVITINGRNIETYSDAELMALIQAAEAELANAKSVKSASSFVMAQVAAKEAALTELIATVDEFKGTGPARPAVKRARSVRSTPRDLKAE